MKRSAAVFCFPRGWMISLIEDLISELGARGVPESKIWSLFVKKGQFDLTEITENLLDHLEHENGVFRINANDGRTTEEIVAVSEYGYVQDEITSKHFPMRQRTGQVIIKLITTGELMGDKYDNYIATIMVLEQALNCGLKRPAYEDALLFGEKFLKGSGRHVYFLHEPWIAPYYDNRRVIHKGEPYAMYLYQGRGQGDGSVLSLHRLYGYYRKDDTFAFVLPMEPGEETKRYF